MNTNGEFNPPSSMNFAVSGTLSIGGDTYTVCIEQQGIAFANVWYMKGANFTSGNDSITTPDGKYSFSEVSSEDTFAVTKN